MLETFIPLLTAHLLADFVFQTNKMVANKRNPFVFFLHILIVVVLAILLLGTLSIPLLVILGISHLMMDALKIVAFKKPTTGFIIDQLFHLAVVVFLAVICPMTFNSGIWAEKFPNYVNKYMIILCLISGLVTTLKVGGIIIGLLTSSLKEEMDATQEEDEEGLTKGGEYIGQLERVLVMIAVLIGQPLAIGFIMTVKSFLRFNDSKKRKAAEYIMIGTFLSITWGVVVAILTNYGVIHFSGKECSAFELCKP